MLVIFVLLLLFCDFITSSFRLYINSNQIFYFLSHSQFSLRFSHNPAVKYIFCFSHVQRTIHSSVYYMRRHLQIPYDARTMNKIMHTYPTYVHTCIYRWYYVHRAYVCCIASEKLLIRMENGMREKFKLTDVVHHTHTHIHNKNQGRQTNRNCKWYARYSIFLPLFSCYVYCIVSTYSLLVCKLHTGDLPSGTMPYQNNRTVTKGFRVANCEISVEAHQTFNCMKKESWREVAKTPVRMATTFNEFTVASLSFSHFIHL